MYTIFSGKLRIRAYYEIESGETEPDVASQVQDTSSGKQIQQTQVRSYAVLQEQILIPSDYGNITDEELYSVVNSLVKDELKNAQLSTVMAHESEKLVSYLSLPGSQERLRKIFVTEHNKNPNNSQKSGESTLDMINRVWDARDTLEQRLKLYYSTQVDYSLSRKREIAVRFSEYDTSPFKNNAEENARKLGYKNAQALITEQYRDVYLGTRTRVYGE